ncbi:MAG: FAD-dependent oxidoreductase [Alphaproteobacteria bacterium]|nr:FAD-dependent oxidoreductase [Alphaproteobacteria bacterium]
MRIFVFFTMIIFSTHLMAANCLREKLSIVGGGVAGSYASHLLKHQRPLLITKEKAPCGKCLSAVVDDRAFDHGAIQVPAYYHRVRSMVDKLGLTLIPNPNPYARDGSTLIETINNTYGAPKFAKDYAKYAYHAWYYGNLTAKPWEVEKYPEVQVSVEDYLHQHAMEAMTPVFDVVLKAYGYGELNTIPMFHAFSIVPGSQIGYSIFHALPLISTTVPTSINLIKEGYQGLVQGMAENANVKTLTNKRVQQIDLRARDTIGHAIITFEGGDILLSEKVILCAPPSNVEILYNSPKKQKLMDELRQSLVTSPYGTIIFETQLPLPNDLIVEKTSTKSFDPIMIGRKFPDKNIYIGYAYGQKKDEMAMRTALKDYTHKHFNDNNITIHSFKAFDDYYPHPTFKAIADGYYSKMESLQGDSGLYFAGSHLSFEIVERTMENVEELVKRHFQ